MANSAQKRLEYLIISLPRKLKKSGGEVPAFWNLNHLSIRHRILIICTHTPTKNHAGGLRILDMLRLIKKKRPEVYIEVFTFLNKETYGSATELLTLADRVIEAESDNFSLSEYERLRGETPPHFDVIDFQFPQPIEVIDSYRNFGNKFIFTPMESLIRNEVIDRALVTPVGASLTNDLAIQEQIISNSSDETICVSKPDRDIITNFVTQPVTAIETSLSSVEFPLDKTPDIEAKSRVVYVAYFGSETNRKALKWYLSQVHKRVLEAVPDYCFEIVGRGDVQDIIGKSHKGIKHRGVKYVGEVDSIADAITGAAIGIAPALSGSGFRGKINQYGAMGLACVATPLATEGLEFEHGKSIYSTHDPIEFANHLIYLLQNPKERVAMASAALSIIKKHYTWESKWEKIANAYMLNVHQRPKTWQPSVHAVVPSYRHAKFLEARITSIFGQEYDNIRVTVVDDASPDTSDQVIRDLQKRYDFEYIARKENSGTPFSTWEYAANHTSEDYIWICESDDAAEKTLIPKLINLLRSDPEAVLAYCASTVTDVHDHPSGSTLSYHNDIIKPQRWERAFICDGNLELKKYQCDFMTVPNMSSALMDTEAFRATFTEDIKRFKLAGDWLFIGQLMVHGKVCYTPAHLNRFRSHPQTSRSRVQEVRMIAEYLCVRYRLNELAGSQEHKIKETLDRVLGITVTKKLRAEDLKAELVQIDPENCEAISKYL